MTLGLTRLTTGLANAALQLTIAIKDGAAFDPPANGGVRAGASHFRATVAVVLP